ncbi:gamma-glutamylcyclotransferase family protein [Amycolatopsis sp. NPDC051061]|uniref:gamma-glutamylcyclotransferase family protein n=1 Tax=Amycolatopsis sp. NPDC051061 TaxID=3155042 RepID=UPI00343D403E
MHVDGVGHPLGTAPGGWRDRMAVLAYGSNANPSKITWLRGRLGLEGPVVVAHARCGGLAAVWAAGFRVVDDQRPATLTAMDGVEEHAIWFVTPDQLAVLDRCEGRGTRYHLARLTQPDITLEDGTRLTEVHTYVGAAPIRYPLLVDGNPVRTTDVPQADAAKLDGVAADGHGVPCEVLRPASPG